MSDENLIDLRKAGERDRLEREFAVAHGQWARRRRAVVPVGILGIALTIAGFVTIMTGRSWLDEAAIQPLAYTLMLIGTLTIVGAGILLLINARKLGEMEELSIAAQRNDADRPLMTWPVDDTVRPISNLLAAAIERRRKQQR